MKYGFIGLGSQGAPMARRMIDAGLDVTLWARRPESLATFAIAKIAPDVATLGADADHVGICVLDDTGVRDICAALIPAMRKGSRIVVHSTTHPDTCIALARDAAARGIDLIDAPVSGGAPGAQAGTLTVMIGGDANVVAATRPVFETFGKLILHLGGVGAGQNAKLINNALMAAHMGLAHQAATIADQLRLDPIAFRELVKASSGRSFGFETYARLPSPQTFAFGAALLAKDVRLLSALMGDEPAANALRDTATPFLDLAQSGAKPAA